MRPLDPSVDFILCALQALRPRDPKDPKVFLTYHCIENRTPNSLLDAQKVKSATMLDLSDDNLFF